MRSRRADIDADALQREHLQPFDVGDNLIFTNDEIIRMVVIVDIVVHFLPLLVGHFPCSNNRNPRSLERGSRSQTSIVVSTALPIVSPSPWTIRSRDWCSIRPA